MWDSYSLTGSPEMENKSKAVKQRNKHSIHYTLPICTWYIDDLAGEGSQKRFEP